MKQRLTYYLIKLFLYAGKILPKKWIYAISKWLLDIYHNRKPKRVSLMHGNIKKAFPWMSESEVVELGKHVYIEVSKTVAETVLLYNNRTKMEDMIVNMEEAAMKLKTLSSDRSKGLLIITGHYSNWELFGQFLGYCGLPVINVTKESSNKLIDEYIVTPFRQRHGNRMIKDKGSMIAMVKAAKNGENISLLIDQVVQPPNGVPVNFFGHKTAATKSTAMLKLKYDPVVVPVFIERVGYEKFEIRVGDPIEPAPAIYTDKQKQIEDMTQDYYDAIEDQIRHRPEQWLWMYNRWKSIRDV